MRRANLPDQDQGLGRNRKETGTMLEVEQRKSGRNRAVVIGSSGFLDGDGYPNPPALSLVSVSDQGCRDEDISHA